MSRIARAGGRLWQASLGLLVLVVGLAAGGFALAATLATAATPTSRTSPTAPTTGGSSPTPTCKPNSLRLAAGSPQTTKVGSAFVTNLQVELANKSGCTLTGSSSGVSVTFSAPSGGASGTFASTGSNTATVGTDASGTATAPTFTANQDEGEYEVRAESKYGIVTFHLTNTATGVAASITAAGTTEQAATVNTQYPQPLQAKVLDAHGAGVQAVTVTFSLGTGPSGAGASFLGGGAQATARTDASGLATSPAVVANGTPGRFTATASVEDVSGAVTFSLDNHAAVYSIKAAGQGTQTATINSRYPAPLQVQVLDEVGRPIEGATVTFAVATGPTGATAGFVGGEGAQATALTDVSGNAHSPALVANGTPGRFTATATVPGGTSPVIYALRNLAGTLTATRPVLTAVVNRRYRERLRARVLGAKGQPLDGITVTFTITKAANGADATFPDGTGQATATTTSAGWASSPALEANSTAGSFTASATSTGIGKPVEYRLRNRAGKPDSITAGAASGESATVGFRFPIRLAVTVVDADDNPIVGAIVIFTAPAHGSSGRFTIHPTRRPRTTRQSRVVHVKTDADGIGVAPPLTANATPGGYVVTARVAGSRQHTAFALVNKPASSP
jgi:protocatechuate 3,4-dioxygenase beta subunit